MKHDLIDYESILGPNLYANGISLDVVIQLQGMDIF